MGAALQIGGVVDHYRLLEKLGEGGMGVVWLAEDTRLGRKVAIKFLPPEAARDAVRRQRFEQEARAAAAISHPGIATVHELAETEGRTYIVFEYVPGRTLRSHVVRGGLQPEELLDIAGDIAEALAAAHTASVVHRDLKPENVMRTPAGTCKVLDFGVARFTTATTPDSATESRSHLTSAGMVVGTVAYMAPEQLVGKEVDFRCDIFSFGTLIYELATGVHPFQGGNSASTIAAIMTAEPPPITQWNRLQPAELERIVRKCLRKRREERYQSTKDLAVDLANLKRDSDERPSSVGAIPAPVHPGDDSLFHKIFASFGATPRRWWELHQLFALFVYAPVALYLALRSSVSISKELNTALASNWHGWQGMMQAIGSESGGPYTFWSNFGLAFFLTLILLLITTVVTRLYLVCLAAFIPERLVAEVRRIQAVLRVVYILVACQFMFAGFFLLRVNTGELILGTGLSAFGLSTLLAVSYAEPGMVRAAFPSGPARDQLTRDELTRSEFQAIGLIQLTYCILFVSPFFGAFSFSRLSRELDAKGALLLFGITFASACFFISLGTAATILAKVRQGLEYFTRFFWLYFLFDLVALGMWFLFLTKGTLASDASPVLLFSFTSPLFLYLPFYQRRTARSLLRESGELKEEQHVAQPSRRESVRTWWWALQASTVLVVGCALAAMMGAFDVPHWTVIPATLRLPVFFFEVFSGWLNISIRVALGLVALSSPDHLAQWVARMRPWIRITGWMIVAGLAVTAVAIVSANGTKAAGAGALATVVAASLLIIEPAVEGAAFPST